MVPEPLAQLTSFYKTPNGSAIYAAERSMLKRFLPQFFGYFLLQIEGPSDLQWLSSSPIRNHLYYTEAQQSLQSPVSCCGSMRALPFDSESIDVLVLPHTLEVISETESLLAEVERCLIPNGVIILLHFVPNRMRFLPNQFKPMLPNLYWRSYTQVNEVLSKHNLSIETTRSFFHQFIQPHAKSSRRLQVFEWLGQLLWPWMGNIQMIIARKKRYTMTPLITASKPPHGLIIGKGVAPTIRNPT